jgi:competence protein ComEA
LVEEEKKAESEAIPKKLGKLLSSIGILVLIGLGCAIYFIWRMLPTNSSTAPILSQSFITSTSKGNTSSSTTTGAPGGTVQVYVTGAVQHPGVYTLSSDARVYQLLQAAGGPLPNANLVVLNLAEKLVDGQEIYVRQIGEAPPIIGSIANNSNDQGQLVNINTASAVDLQQKLRLSAKSAQGIINYRQQHGSFDSVDELLKVVSKTIYDRIKGQVTV